MRVKVGVKEDSKKKLVRRSCRKNLRRKIGREQMPKKWRGNGGDGDRNCDEK